MSAAAFATLDQLVNDLRGAGDDLPRIARELVPVLEEQAREAIASRASMSGEKWPATKDGHAPLQGAMKSITVKAIGDTIFIRMSGYEVWHQYGTKRTPKRAIIPSAGLNAKVGNAIRFGIVDAGLTFMNRAGRHDKPKRGRR
jgi:hypothetical protein